MRDLEWRTPLFAAASLTGSASAVGGSELAANGVRAVVVDPVASDVLGLHGPLARLGGPRAMLGGAVLVITDSGSRLIDQLPRRRGVASHGRLLRVGPTDASFASPVDGSVRSFSAGESARLQLAWRPDLATAPYQPSAMPGSPAERPPEHGWQADALSAFTQHSQLHFVRPSGWRWRRRRLRAFRSRGVAVGSRRTGPG